MSAEMRDLTADEQGQVTKYLKGVQVGIVDAMLHGRGDAIFDDWATNLLYACNEDTSLRDHTHLACLDTADRYNEGVERLELRRSVSSDKVPEDIRGLRFRVHLMRAGTRLVALESGLVQDDHIADALGEIESLLAGAAEEWAMLVGLPR